MIKGIDAFEDIGVNDVFEISERLWVRKNCAAQAGTINLSVSAKQVFAKSIENWSPGRVAWEIGILRDQIRVDR